MSLKRILDAESVVIIGASRDVTKRGYQAVRTLLSDKYEGKIYLVNPRGGNILGLPCYRSVLEIDDPIDVALITVPAKLIPSIIEDCGKKGIAGAVIIAAGYGETGPEGETLERTLMEKAKEGNVRIIGPNTNGFINFKKNMNLVGVKDAPRGDFALLTQSGNMALALMNEARDHGLSGFSYYVGVGNQIDVGFDEYLEFFADDADTKAIVMYLEGIKDGRKFIQQAYKITDRKPIIVLKGGRSETGKKSARSHTGALAGQYQVYLSAFKSAGITSLDNPEELFPVAETLSNMPPIKNNTVAILADGGGHATIASDLLTDHRVGLIELAEGTRARLKKLLPDTASVANPVDVAGGTDSDPELLAECAKIILEDDRVGGLLIVGMFGGYGIRFAEKLKFAEEAAAHRFGKIVAAARKPLVIHSIYANANSHAIEVLRHYRIPVYGSLNVACKCIAALSDYGAYLKNRYTEDRFVLNPGVGARKEGNAIISKALKEKRTSLMEHEAKELLRIHGIPVTSDFLAKDADEAARITEEFGCKVVLKVVSPDILHKSDVGGVRLNLKNGNAARQTFVEIMDSVREFDPNADIRGCLVSPMVENGIELIIGVNNDQQFGPVTMFGLGGILVEVFKDVAFRLLPLFEDDAKQIIVEVKSSVILDGVRGKRGVDKKALCELLLKVSQVVQAYPHIEELDLNPVFATENGVVVADARVLLKHDAACSM
ncbi:MAG: acetate--CoA ligase family protein [Deltaproteobacteria bacterium]|nr:acetate--CoA ligase family protein [Deltaproteobacteria bacterium]